MTMSSTDRSESKLPPAAKRRFRYLSPPVPVHFPVEAEMPEGKTHSRQCAELYDSLREAFRDCAWLGSDQFVYWDPTDPAHHLAPDVMLKWGGPDAEFDIWKVWERGAPELAIEIVSASDRRPKTWAAKLERYRRLGVKELVRFDPHSDDNPIRIWDVMADGLTERDVRGSESGTASCVVDGYWVVVPHPDGLPALRLARDPAGNELYPTSLEAERERAAAADERAAAADERAAVLAAKLKELGVDPSTVK